MDVRVTLESPWQKDAYGEEIPVILRYGSTPARIIGGGNIMISSDLAANSDELVDVGSHADKVPFGTSDRPESRIIPGKPIEWTFLNGDPEKNGLLMPIEAVMLWFGNWRMPKTASPGTPPDETYSYERNRVAMKWGWWQMPRTGPTGLSHLRRGEEGPDTTKIGAPRVPHVLIQSVDGRGQTTDKITFRPWDWFQWQGDVVPQTSSSSATEIETFSVDQLRRLADEMELRQTQKKTQKVA